MKSPLHSVHAPQPIGPYSQAIRAGDFVFLSGQIGIDPAVGKITAGDAVGQATQALKNIRAILTAAGLTPEHVIKTTIFLADMNDFAAVNEAYGRVLPRRPARAFDGASRATSHGRQSRDRSDRDASSRHQRVALQTPTARR
jgi:reactive intermediate/imine deaminase